MIPFMGKCWFKVFNPKKPDKWGIKEYVITDDIGYTLEVRIYHGADFPEETCKKNKNIFFILFY